MLTHILFNPLADNGRGKENAQKIEHILHDSEYDYTDITACDSIIKCISDFGSDDKVVIAGGDGTLNRIINTLGDSSLNRRVFYFPAGSGNDFMTDVRDDSDNGLIEINKYIEKLPYVTVNGKTCRFINGIGYGIDGYCCEEGDKLRKAGNSRVNYTSIAIKGLLFGFKPANAVVTVDGVRHEYKKVWLAPTMNGRFYGGGMMVAPAQNRLNSNKTLSVVVMHGSGKLKTLAVFPSIFKGEHVKHKEMVEVLTGNEISVEFDRPTALQIDGETVPGVTKCECKSAKNTVTV